MRIPHTVLAIMFSLVLTTQSLADIRSIKLEALVEISEYIVLGKVIRVTSLNKDFRVAEIEITETLKGDPRVRKLYYSISLKMPEDISDARVGETALLFLRKPQTVSPTGYPEAIAEVTRGAPLFYICHNGRGRMVPTIIDDQPYVYAHRSGSIIFPDSLTVTSRRDGTDPEIVLIRLTDLIRSIKAQLPESGL